MTRRILIGAVLVLLGLAGARATLAVSDGNYAQPSSTARPRRG